MEHPFFCRSPLRRAVFAVAAVCATMSLGVLIEALSNHYSEKAIVATLRANPTLVAAR